MTEVLVFSSYHTDLDYIRAYCDTNNIPYENICLECVSSFVIKFKNIADIFKFSARSIDFLSKCMQVNTNRYKLVMGITNNLAYSLELIDSTDF